MRSRHVNEKNFTWCDVRISTVYGMLDSTPYATYDHIHSQYEMFIFKDGGGEMTVGGKSVRIGRNLCVIVPPHTVHSLRLEPGVRLLGMTVRFVYKNAVSTGNYTGDKVFDILNEVLPKTGSAAVLRGRYFGHFSSSFKDEREGSPIIASMLIRHLMEGLFIEIMRSLSRKSDDDTPIFSYTSRGLPSDLVVAIVIDEYMSKPGCTLAELSRKIKMSPRNIQRIIRNTYGKSFSERLAEIRISYATFLMSDPSLTLSEISQRANYNRYDSFRKAFVQKMGVSPTEYREAHFGINYNEKG